MRGSQCCSRTPPPPLPGRRSFFLMLRVPARILLPNRPLSSPLPVSRAIPASQKFLSRSGPIRTSPLHHEDCNVVRLRRAIGELAHFFEQTPRDISRRSLRESTGLRQQTIAPVTFLTRVKRFDHPIRIQNQGITTPEL